MHKRAVSTVKYDPYEEIAQLTTIKSPDFYAEQAKHRNYFYYVDLQGRLFLEDTVPKNITTSLKSDKFLKFFFRNIKKTASSLLKDKVWLEDYGFMSLCGNECNFIRPGDTPIVFNDISLDKNFLLYCNGQFSVKFDPSALAIDDNSGRLYHPLGQHKYLPHSSLCLIGSNVAISFSEHLIGQDNCLYFQDKDNILHEIRSISHS